MLVSRKPAGNPTQAMPRGGCDPDHATIHHTDFLAMRGRVGLPGACGAHTAPKQPRADAPRSIVARWRWVKGDRRASSRPHRSTTRSTMDGRIGDEFEAEPRRFTLMLSLRPRWFSSADRYPANPPSATVAITSRPPATLPNSGLAACAARRARCVSTPACYSTSLGHRASETFLMVELVAPEALGADPARP